MTWQRGEDITPEHTGPNLEVPQVEACQRPSGQLAAIQRPPVKSTGFTFVGVCRREGVPWHSRQHCGASSAPPGLAGKTQPRRDLVEMAIMALQRHVHPRRVRHEGSISWPQSFALLYRRLYISACLIRKGQVKRQLWHEYPRSKNNSPSGDLEIIVMP